MVLGGLWFQGPMTEACAQEMNRDRADGARRLPQGRSFGYNVHSSSCKAVVHGPALPHPLYLSGFVTAHRDTQSPCPVSQLLSPGIPVYGGFKRQKPCVWEQACWGPLRVGVPHKQLWRPRPLKHRSQAGGQGHSPTQSLLALGLGPRFLQGRPCG